MLKAWLNSEQGISMEDGLASDVGIRNRKAATRARLLAILVLTDLFMGFISAARVSSNKPSTRPLAEYIFVRKILMAACSSENNSLFNVLRHFLTLGLINLPENLLAGYSILVIRLKIQKS